MKKKLEIMIKHIQDNSTTCYCPLCHRQENYTYLDALKDALDLIPKRRK